MQILVSIKYSLEATGKFLAHQNVEKPVPLIQAQTNLSNAITDIRRISHHLHPRILDELGLSDAMEALGKEFSERTNIAVTITKPAPRHIYPSRITKPVEIN